MLKLCRLPRRVLAETGMMRKEFCRCYLRNSGIAKLTLL